MPWGDIITRIEEFVDPEYLPLDFAFATPDHLRVKSCVELLNHLRKRQAEHGVGDKVFAWKSFCQKQRGGDVAVTPALISFDQADGEDIPLPPRPRPRPRGKGKGKQAFQNAEESESDSGMETPAGHSWDAFDAGQGVQDSSDSDSELDETRLDLPGQSFPWMQKRARATIMTQPDVDEESEEEDSEKEALMKKPARKGKKQGIFTDSDDDFGLALAGENDGNQRVGVITNTRPASIMHTVPSGRDMNARSETRPDAGGSPAGNPPTAGPDTAQQGNQVPAGDAS